MGQRFTKTLGSVMVVTVAMAGAVSVGIGGDHVAFEKFQAECAEASPLDHIWITPLVSVLAGLLGGLWSVGLLLGVHIKQWLVQGRWWAPYAVACACGALLCCTGYWSGGDTFGSGFDVANRIIAPQAACPLPKHPGVSIQLRGTAFPTRLRQLPTFPWMCCALPAWTSTAPWCGSSRGPTGPQRMRCLGLAIGRAKPSRRG